LRRIATDTINPQALILIQDAEPNALDETCFNPIHGGMASNVNFELSATSYGRILEIGETGLFYWGMPEQTDALYASYRADLRQGRRYLGIRSFIQALRAVRRGEYALVVLHPPYYPGWHWRSLLPALKFTVLKGRPFELYSALTSPLLFELTRLFASDRIIAVDRSDSFGIPAHHFFLLDKARSYLKRELPFDHWKVFYGSGHRRLPGKTFRSKKRWLDRMRKIRPIGLGLPNGQVKAASSVFGAEKKSDVFFAGTVSGNSSVRSDALGLLGDLRSAGFKVDVPEHPLPRDEFMLRCAQSWLTLSPEGLGWDCYRHMEAALAGSVPLLSAPTIHRYKPMVVGAHCLSYLPDENRIVDIVRTALADKEQLRNMASAGRQHVLDHLTDRALCLSLYGTFAGHNSP
jgi:hypothetical protein